MATRRTSGRASQSSVARYLREAHDPLTSLALTVPVFLVYHLGILLVDLRNGVDLVSQLTFRLLDYSVLAYAGVTLGVALGFVVAGLWLRGRGRVRPSALLPVLAESSVLSVLMLLLVGWATQRVFASQVGPPPLGPLDKLVLAAGAGFHEELVFRVGLYAGGAALLQRVLRLRPMGAHIWAAVVAALLFSSVHYIGALADPFTLMSFTFRFLAGLYLTAVFHFRGFAVAVYTHALYDVIVFFVV